MATYNKNAKKYLSTKSLTYFLVIGLSFGVGFTAKMIETYEPKPKEKNKNTTQIVKNPDFDKNETKEPKVKIDTAENINKIIKGEILPAQYKNKKSLDKNEWADLVEKNQKNNQNPVFLGEIKSENLMETDRRTGEPKSDVNTAFKEFFDKNSIEYKDWNNETNWLAFQGVSKSREFFLDSMNNDILIPKQPLCKNISWKDLYNVGFVYDESENYNRIDFTDPVYRGIVDYKKDSNEYKRYVVGNITLNGELYHIKLISTTKGSGMTKDTSEYDDLIKSLCDPQYKINYSYKDDLSFNKPVPILTREMDYNNAQMLIKGGESDLEANKKIDINDKNTEYGWIPVLVKSQYY